MAFKEIGQLSFRILKYPHLTVHYSIYPTMHCTKDNKQKPTLLKEQICMSLTLRFLISSPTTLILLNLRKRVMREGSLYTTSGISVSLLWRKSSTFSCVKLTKVSGSEVREFSDRPSVCKFTKRPISGGRVDSLLLLKCQTLTVNSPIKHQWQNHTQASIIYFLLFIQKMKLANYD